MVEIKYLLLSILLVMSRLKQTVRLSGALLTHFQSMHGVVKFTCSVFATCEKFVVFSLDLVDNKE